MASYTDLNKTSSMIEYRSSIKTTPAPIVSCRKFVEPFARLKNRANLFRRKNYSSQTDISNPRSSLPADHFIPIHELPSIEDSMNMLKRSNSMICPQQRLQTFLKRNRHQRNSICVQLDDCPIDESSTDEHQFNKSSSNQFWNQKMSNISEQDIFPSDESLHNKQIEPESVVFDDLIFKPPSSTMKSSSVKISTCTMTGKSLNNLDECNSNASSEDKGVQTTFDPLIGTNCSTSLSSSSTSIQTDSLENKSKTNPIIKHFSQEGSFLHEEQTCIYWVNYLGSIAIPVSNDNNTSRIPINAINQLKQSTRFARVLPIIGLSISSQGVEFLKHAKDRVVICFHDIKFIHCACQDQDLRYFAYVTREQRATTSTPLSSSTKNFSKENYHHFCHVFVVKNQSMSTEILLNFGQAFHRAYRVHRRLNYLNQTTQLKKCKKINSSSSSSSSSDEQRVFV